MSPERDHDVEVPRGGVLAALPRTRPQRASARRVATRARARPETDKPASAPKRTSAARAKAKAKEQPVKKQTVKKQPVKKAVQKTVRKTAKRAAVKRRPPPPRPERAPKQGYEPEEEVELGNTVHPPSGGELIESIADIFGELAGAGAAAGARLLRDAFSIFRRP